MFIIRRLHRLFRLYTFVLICGTVVVGVDYDMQAKAVGHSIGTYDPGAYLSTLQRRLGGQASMSVVSGGRVDLPEDEVTSPLDLAFRAMRGLAVAKAHVLGQDLEADQVVLLPPPDAAPVLVPRETRTFSTQDEQGQRPCVRRGNVLDC